MSTTQALADAVATLEDAAELYQNQNTTINEAVDSMQEQVSGYVSSARAEQGFLVINKNHHLLDTVPAVGDNQLAVGMGLNGGGDFFSKFATTMIRVSTGVEPSTRPPIARELLDAMGIGANTRHFSGSFNIFHIRRIDNTFQSTEPLCVCKDLRLPPG